MMLKCFLVFSCVVHFQYLLLFTIFVDCCDGSDEYDGSVNCPNTCIMGGNIEYKTDHRFSRVGGLVGDLGHVGAKQAKSGVSLDDLIQKLKGILLFLTTFLLAEIICKH